MFDLGCSSRGEDGALDWTHYGKSNDKTGRPRSTRKEANSHKMLYRNEAERMSQNLKFWITLAASFVIAYLSWSAPTHQMPLDYGAMISRSVPFAGAWALVLAFSLWRHKTRGLWLLAGSPMAFYWPMWLLFNRFPPCYYSHNCI